MKIEINVPSTLNEITLGQYQKYLKIAESNPEGTFLDAKMVEIFCGIPLSDSYKLKMASVSAITDIINSLLEATPKHVPRFTMNGIDYGFIPDLDDMSLGEYIDLDNNASKWEQMHVAMNVLYRPIKTSRLGKYNIEEYDVNNPEEMKDMPLGAAIGSLFFFLQFRNRIVESYDSLFQQSGGDGGYSKSAQFGSKWGWYQSIYALANGCIERFEDITKLNVHQCFTFLSFTKEKAEIEQQQIKNKF
tara:strand:- start:245 stop:982 length:738 start_codon:yes stop_codon:yes gene_type:complete